MASHQTSRFVTLGIGVFLMLAVIVSMGAPLRMAHADTDNGDQNVATDQAPDPNAPNIVDANNPPQQSQTATSTEGTGGLSSDTGGSIETGDAIATSSVDNSLNQNSSFPDSKGTTNSSTITASTTNAGELDSAASSTAETGTNAVVGGEGANSIKTGDAIATSNVINEVNTNIFNSDGLILFINQLFGGGFDLNDYDLSFFFAGGPGASPTTNPLTGNSQCTLLTCLNSSTLNVLNDNTATVTNSVLVRASTGTNSASSTGDTDIDTGNAYAAANVVNLVNTNIINSSYLLLAFNNFGDINDTITLPSADFFSRLFNNGAVTTSMNSSTYTVNDNNNVTFTGTTTADAITGDNQALEQATSTEQVQPTGSGTVNTGSAYASSNTYNQLNTNNVGGTSVFMLFRVAGNWNGQVIGLPEGLAQNIYQNGDDKYLEFTSIGASTTPAMKWLQKYNSSQFVAAATNTAAIDNNVQVEASTGANQAISDTGDATVNTGDAYASASVVNLVNTNIIGQNWIFAIFNVFGNLNGNIVFGGSPLLLITADPSSRTVAPGSDVDYTFTVTNSGNANASNVVLNASFDNTLLSFDPSQGGEVTPTGESWHLGNIPKGTTQTFVFHAHVGTNFPQNAAGQVPFSVAVVNDNINSPATSNTTDATIVVSWPGATNTSSGSGGGGGGGGVISGVSSGKITADANVAVVKTVSVATTTAPTSVDYKVVVTNDKGAGPVFNGVLTDTLTDPDGGVVYTRSWDLATIAPGDEITLTYSVGFASTTHPGIYHNVAQVTGTQNNPVMYYAIPIVPVNATGTVEFLDNGMVLGDATSTPEITDTSNSKGSCKVIEGYVKPGASNKPADVFRLQAFLNTQGEHLATSGKFDAATLAAVNRFQMHYAADILAPLHLTKPTGNVLGATQAQINKLGCSGNPPFSLTPQQVQQIATLTAGTVSRTGTPAKPTPKQTVKAGVKASGGSQAQAAAAASAKGTSTTNISVIGKKIGGLFSSIWGAIR